LENYLRPDHFDAIGRLLIVVAVTWFFFFFVEWIFALYTLEGPELALREFQVFQAPNMWLFLGFLLTAFFIPVPMWMFKRVRRSPMLMFFSTILVNVGMWLERFLIIIPGLARRQPLSFDWGTYNPSIVEILIVLETFAFVALGMLLFAKFFPIIPIFDMKEGMEVREEIKIGRRIVPASIRETP
jgi:Ni/Fe-hydrogenase subunit HybB-like protein